MRVSCEHNQFGLNANHRNSTSMRIHVDRPLGSYLAIPLENKFLKISQTWVGAF